MSIENDDLENLKSNLWTISCQIRALGELLLFQHREPALDEKEIWYGYGITLRELGERLSAMSKPLDNGSCKKRKKRN
jgi:hypothetical protein